MKIQTYSATLLFLAVTLAGTVAAASRSVPLDGYAATVNDRIIMVSDVLASMAPVQQQLRATYSGDELEKKLKEAFEASLDALIEKALIVEDFKHSKAEIPERMIDERVNSFIHDNFDNDRAAFLQALAEQRMTIEEWRKDFKERMIVMMLGRQRVADRVVVAPRAVWEAYLANAAEYHVPAKALLRIIVLNRGQTDQDQEAKRQQAESILEQLKDGADFGELAATHSEDAKSKNGGSWGWIETRQLRAELAAAAERLSSGALSEVIATDDMLYILQVEGKKEAATIPFEEVRPRIEKQLRQVEEDRLYASWIALLREQYFIKKF